MDSQQFVTDLRKQIQYLSRERQLQLGVSVSKKLFPDYLEFYNLNGWGNPNTLLEAINLISEFILEETNIEEGKRMIQIVADITPDTEDFENASYALNACVSISEALDFLIDGDIEHIINVTSCLTDTIDFKTQANTNLKENEIDNHPMMIKAREFLMSATR